jgi:hypothetical protein
MNDFRWMSIAKGRTSWVGVDTMMIIMMIDTMTDGAVHRAKDGRHLVAVLIRAVAGEAVAEVQVVKACRVLLVVVKRMPKPVSSESHGF